MHFIINMIFLSIDPLKEEVTSQIKYVMTNTLTEL